VTTRTILTLTWVTRI